jgi:hypothetical protein
VGHHHHGGGGGGGHHHHHHHGSGGGLPGGFGGGWGRRPGYYSYFGANWTVAIAFAFVLCAYGLADGIGTYRVYAHGEHAMGVVTHVDDGTTILEVAGHVCAVDGELGHVGGMVPVAFPLGRPDGCVVHRLSAFRWPGGALLLGSLLIAVVVVWRRGAMPAASDKPAS